MQNRTGQWLLSNSSCFIHKPLAHSSVEGEKWGIKSIQYSLLTLWILLREKNAFCILALEMLGKHFSMWSQTGVPDTYVNVLVFNDSANSHRADLWTSLSPTATSHQHSLLLCVNACLISHPTPSATSPPNLALVALRGQTKHAIHASAHIDHFSDADWCMQVINWDAGSPSYNKTGGL